MADGKGIARNKSVENRHRDQGASIEMLPSAWLTKWADQNRQTVTSPQARRIWADADSRGNEFAKAGPGWISGHVGPYRYYLPDVSGLFPQVATPLSLTPPPELARKRRADSPARTSQPEAAPPAIGRLRA